MNKLITLFMMVAVTSFATAQCDPVSGLTVNSVQAGAVTISWIPGGTENQWHVQVGPPGYVPGSGQQMMNGIAWSNTNFEISGTMTPNTTYDIYVRANCGNSTYSDWGTPQTFTTATTCADVINVTVSDITAASVKVSITPGDTTQSFWSYVVGLPGFDPNDTSQYVDGIGTGLTNGVQMYSMSANTTYEVRVRAHCGSSVWSDWSTAVLFTTLTCMDITDVSVANITSFTADVSWIAGGTETVWDIEYGPQGFATGTGTMAYLSDTQYSITGLTPGTAYDVRIRTYCGWQNTSNWVNQTFTTAAFCDDITGLSTSNASNTSVDIAWTAGGSETSWDIEYGPQGYTQGSSAGTLITITTNPYTLVGLIEGYAYDVYVRSNCGSGSIGNWEQANFSTTGTLCIVNIPDANFKAALVGNIMINTNGDTEIQCYEANAFTGYIGLFGQSIADLTGIEAFVNATNLDAGSNDLISADLSQNTKLTMIYLDHNQLTSLDVSTLADLTFLNCSSNDLSTLELTSNTKLTNLSCGNNNLSVLDVSQNTDLLFLGCNDNQIEMLDVSNNVNLFNLNCADNTLTHLNVKNGNNISLFIIAIENPDLNCIEVDDVAWSTANWSNNVDNPVAFSDDCFTTYLSVGDVVMAPMNVRLYPNPFSDVITITSDQNLIESVKVYDLKGVLLYQTRDNSTELNVNLSNLSSGIYLIKTASQNGEAMHKVVKR